MDPTTHSAVAEDAFFDRLVSDLGRLAPLELDPSCDHRYTADCFKARFFDIPHSIDGDALRPGTRTVSLRRKTSGCVEIVICDFSAYGACRESRWTVRSGEILPPVCRHVNCMYLGELFDRFDALWRLVESGAIASKPVEQELW